MKRAASFFLLVLAAAGCSQPLRVQTRDRVSVETPIFTNNQVSVDSPPVSNPGPVVEMRLGARHCPEHAAKVAVLDVDGLLFNADMTGFLSLGDNPVSLFRERLDAIAADSAVRAVVVRINSPGGGVTASDIMWRDLQAFRARTHRPVIACLMDLGTGGGYYLATASDLIVAHPTTITGGIGVILNLYNLRDLMAQFNVVSQTIKSGPNIDIGSPIRTLSPEQKQVLQAIADEFHARFKEVVRQARPALAQTRAPIFDGRVFTARQALANGLVDRVGYLEDALAAAKELARVQDARVVFFHRRNDPARSPYAITPNVPLQASLLPSIPGLDRSHLPTFLYLWQPEATMEKLSGK